MLVVSDAMVLIHLAKITILEKSCERFGRVIIPPQVFEETVVAGKAKGFEDATLIGDMVQRRAIEVIKIREKRMVEKANAFNVFGGEAEAVALYWQEGATRMACDDDNVRNKKEVLEVNLVGTPAIILSLYREKKISSEKARQAILKLRRIGWFGSGVLDKILLEVERDG